MEVSHGTEPDYFSNFCKYQDTTDEEGDCDWIRNGGKCPLDLQEEITYYRAHQRPGRIVEQHGTYCCPACRKYIASELIDNYKIKYCPECGKRIIKHQPIILGK